MRNEKHLRQVIIPVLIGIIFLGLGLQSCKNRKTEVQGKLIIFDSDIGPSCDDVAALTMLHALEDAGEVKILATVADNKYPGVASVLDVINTYWGRPDIPIGIPKSGAPSLRDEFHWTDSLMQSYPHDLRNNDDVPGSVEIYRQVLSAQEDSSLTIVSVGFLNNLAKLLQSEPDEYSRLNGRDLVMKKVDKLVCMGGEFPSGKEFNMYKDAQAAQKVAEQWPTRIIFTGFEIGKQIFTGLPLLKQGEKGKNPLRDAYAIVMDKTDGDSLGRRSWDQSAILIAAKGVKPYFNSVNGKIQVHTDGSNDWSSSGYGHSYVKFAMPPDSIAEIINQLMLETPAGLSTQEK